MHVFTFSCSFLRGHSYFHTVVDCLIPQVWLIQRILERTPYEVSFFWTHGDM